MTTTTKKKVKAIAKAKPATPAVVQSMSPIQQITAMKDMGLSAEDLKQMLAVQKEYEENEARKAFNQAVADFRENPPKVYKDKVNQQYDSKYASIGNVVNTVSAELSKHGLSTRWEFSSSDNNVMYCTCILSHRLGHSESATVDGLPDESGKKNLLQARKSTRTYLKLESFEAVTGLASEDANVDDDGNSAVVVELIDEEQALTIDSMMEENELSWDLFWAWVGKKFVGVDAIEKFPASSYDVVIAKINQSIEAKKANES